MFLDEIGDTELSIQVKLLRVLETRSFQPLGSTETRAFRGKAVAATNRDLGRAMRQGRFREDLYYRLCADTIQAPSLVDRITDSPEEMSILVRFLAQRTCFSYCSMTHVAISYDTVLCHITRHILGH